MIYNFDLSELYKVLIEDIIKIKEDILEHENNCNNNKRYNSTHKIKHKSGQLTIAEYKVKTDTLKVYCLKDENSIKEDVFIKLKIH